jgi:hypothetical protein
MLAFTLHTVYSDSTYCWLTGIDTEGDLPLGTEYVQTTVTLALRNYNLPNAVTPLGWHDHEPCFQR